MNASAAHRGAAPSSRSASARVILFVWDGLRPDSINPEDTPRLVEFSRGGTVFSDQHATCPTYTMVNAASFATGTTPSGTGFFGNTLWQPAAAKLAPSGTPLVTDGGVPVRYEQPTFTEDYAVLRDLDEFYGGHLLLAGSLLQAAHAGGLATTAVGKSGPAYLQDRQRRGFVLDEKGAWPIAFARELQASNLPLPRTTALAYSDHEITVDGEQNGDPTAILPAKKTLADGQTADPTASHGGPAARANQYFMRVYKDLLLPEKRPALSVVWLRSPDTAEHWYGPGTANVKDALHELDELFGVLLDSLEQRGWLKETNVLVVSDHGHSTVSGNFESFPLRAIERGKQAGRVGAPNPSGYSVSGDVRLADLLTRIGKFHAYDGVGCLYNPVLSGILANGKPLYPVRRDDPSGTTCGKDPKTGKGALKYNTPSYRVPSKLPADAVVIAINGGSDYIYVPSHEQGLLERVVQFLQARAEVGALFVSARYRPVPGTLPMTALSAESEDRRRNPDLIVGYTYDENAVVSGMKGIEYAGAQNSRGMHGSFSPVDIHNTLIARGPDFRSEFTDPLPTANIDVAPTIAKVLGIPLPQANGRVLEEALSASRVSVSDYTVKDEAPLVSSTRTNLRMLLASDTDGTQVDRTKSKYRVLLKTRTLVRGDARYTYYDWAKAIRE